VTSRLLPRYGEDGATLLFVIGFMVMVGLMMAGVTTQLASSSTTRVALDVARNKQYAADGAIETDIGVVRDRLTRGNSRQNQCPPSSLVQNPGLNGVPIQVDCTYLPNLFTLSGFVQRDAVFTACPPQAVGTACPASAVIIEARVNFASENASVDSSIVVNKTYIQSWSVKS
jgi:hypothetical protein